MGTCCSQIKVKSETRIVLDKIDLAKKLKVLVINDVDIRQLAAKFAVENLTCVQVNNCKISMIAPQIFEGSISKLHKVSLNKNCLKEIPDSLLQCKLVDNLSMHSN